MATTLTPDICVIGGGAGGFAFAEEAVRAGASIVLVERQEPGGGPVRDVMPLHALLAAASHAQAMRDAATFGVVADETRIDFKAVARHLRMVTAAAARDRSAARLAAMGVHVLKEQARFADRRTVRAGEHEIRAGHVVVATGSVPVAAPFPGLDLVDPLTPALLPRLARKPARLVVIGDGRHGLAFAQGWRRLGCGVVAIEPGGALANEDPEQAAIVLEALRAEGVVLRDHAEVLRVERRGKTGVRVVLGHAEEGEEAFDANALLFLPQRRPAVDDLDLASAGISFTADGIEVDDTLRTSNRRVYAIGDVTGGRAGVHLAVHQARLVAQALLSGRRGGAGPTAVPRIVFTSPQIAAIGLSAAEARSRHGRVQVLRWPLAETDGARAAGRTRGFIKLVADERERILGVSIAADDAAELIATWELAINGGLDVAAMANAMPPYPSRAEAGKSAAIAYFSERARKPGARGIFRFPRILG